MTGQRVKIIEDTPNPVERYEEAARAYGLDASSENEKATAHLVPYSSALEILPGIPFPSDRDFLSPSRITSPTVSSQAVTKAAMPHLGYEFTNLAIQVEREHHNKLSKQEATVQKFLGEIDKLLELNKHLAAVSQDADTIELSEEIQAILKDLNEPLLDEETKTLAKDKLIELKSRISNHIDQNRTKVQVHFTKVQTILQEMNSMIESAKRALNSDDRLKGTLTRNERVGA